MQKLPSYVIPKVYKQGRRVRRRLVLGIYMKAEPTQCGWAVVVSKKISKRAVDRNRLKRQVREIVNMLEYPDFPFACLVVVLPAAKQAPFAHLKAEIQHMFAGFLQ